MRFDFSSERNAKTCKEKKFASENMFYIFLLQCFFLSLLLYDISQSAGVYYCSKPSNYITVNILFWGSSIIFTLGRK